MTVRDELEMILELHDEVKKLEQMIADLFNKIYAEHLKERSKVE